MENAEASFLDITFDHALATTLTTFHDLSDDDHDEVLELDLALDVGDISHVDDTETRQAIWDTRRKFNPDAPTGDDMISQLGHLDDAIDDGRSLRVWISNDPSDLCGYYWLCARLAGNMAGEVFTVNVTRHAMKLMGVYKRNTIGDMSLDELVNQINNVTSVNGLTLRDIKHIWDVLVAENAPLRVNVNGVIISVADSFYDQFVYASVQDTPTKLSAVVELTIEAGPGGMPLWWYLSRIDTLVANQMIEYVGDERDVADAEVKRVTQN
ncbi:DUF3658 domain-containing protein [Levilactobacillus bambusae]|uniref:DUF3658 domain-containing protein n=1 Tax=Levilactobacillus bambusae TaxID=2024736 RepID=UPI0014039A52|nr:DUF3658 domain-containing protein [Levilactobacillus bambusae]